MAGQRGIWTGLTTAERTNNRRIHGEGEIRMDDGRTTLEQAMGGGWTESRVREIEQDLGWGDGGELVWRGRMNPGWGIRMVPKWGQER